MPKKLEEFLIALSTEEAEELWEWLNSMDDYYSPPLAMQSLLLDSHPEIN